jgi:hypothetical protein
MSYEAVDDSVSAWAARHGLRLITEFAGRPCRFCYVSGGEDECYQVSVEPPEDGIITVNVWDVETRDDAELHRAWHVPVGDLGPTLEEAWEEIARWGGRGLRS